MHRSSGAAGGIVESMSAEQPRKGDVGGKDRSTLSLAEREKIDRDRKEREEKSLLAGPPPDMVKRGLIFDSLAKIVSPAFQHKRELQRAYSSSLCLRFYTFARMLLGFYELP